MPEKGHKIGRWYRPVRDKRRTRMKLREKDKETDIRCREKEEREAAHKYAAHKRYQKTNNAELKVRAVCREIK